MIEVKKLRELCTARIKELDTKAAKEHKGAKAEYDRKLADWRKNVAPEYAADLRALAARVAKGQPVVQYDVNQVTGDGYSGTRRRAFDCTDPGEPKVYGDDVRALLTLLDTMGDDDKVSLGQLRDLGYRNLRNILA